MAQRHQVISGLSPKLFVLMLAVAIVGSNSLLLSPILAEVAGSLHASVVAVSRAIAAYSGATAISALLLGPRIDGLGPRRALFAGLACLAAALLLSAVAWHWAWLAAAQCLAGLGAGLVLPAGYGLAIALAPSGQETRAMGRVLTGWSVALVGGVPASALLAQEAGWRAPFLVLAALAIAACWAATSLSKETHRPAGAARGHLLAPLRIPGVGVLLAICMAYMASFYGVYAFVADRVRVLDAVSTGAMGLIVLGYGLGFGAASLADGWVDRFGPRKIFPATLLALAVIYGLMPPATRHFGIMVGLAGLWGFANHFGLNVLVVLLGRASAERRGAVLGLNSAVTYVGSMAGVALAGPLYAGAGFDALGWAAAALMAAAALLAKFG